jgi:hypothetical protein
MWNLPESQSIVSLHPCLDDDNHPHPVLGPLKVFITSNLQCALFILSQQFTHKCNKVDSIKWQATYLNITALANRCGQQNKNCHIVLQALLEGTVFRIFNKPKLSFTLFQLYTSSKDSVQALVLLYCTCSRLQLQKCWNFCIQALTYVLRIHACHP